MDKNSPLRHPIRRPIRSSVRACLLVVLLLLTGLVASAPSRAHIVPEEPWHPAPAAYLRSLFYANLTPIDWALIDREYNRPPTSEFAAGLDSAYQALDLAASLEGVRHSADIQSAIDNQDRSALYLASTRAVSQLSRFYLRQAAAQVAEPGAASADIQQAQRIYRAFDSFILQVDEAAARDLGRAWLELASSAGHAGVAGVGGAASDPERFEAARTQIEEYLIENYEQMLFHQDGDLAPLPSSMAADKSVAAWLPPGSRLNDQDPLPLL